MYVCVTFHLAVEANSTSQPRPVRWCKTIFRNSLCKGSVLHLAVEAHPVPQPRPGLEPRRPLPEQLRGVAVLVLPRVVPARDEPVPSAEDGGARVVAGGGQGGAGGPRQGGAGEVVAGGGPSTRVDFLY